MPSTQTRERPSPKQHEECRQQQQKNGVQTNSNSNSLSPNKTNANNTNYQKDRKPGPVEPACETCGKTDVSTEKCYVGANAANRPPPRNRWPEGQNQVQQRNAQNNSDENVQAAAQNLN